jgi:hypothetical protein
MIRDIDALLRGWDLPEKDDDSIIRTWRNRVLRVLRKLPIYDLEGQA